MTRESSLNSGSGRRKVAELPSARLAELGIRPDRQLEIVKRGPLNAYLDGYLYGSLVGDEEGHGRGLQEGRAQGYAEGLIARAGVHSWALAAMAILAGTLGAALGFLIRGLG